MLKYYLVTFGCNIVCGDSESTHSHKFFTSSVLLLHFLRIFVNSHSSDMKRITYDGFCDLGEFFYMELDAPQRHSPN